MPEENEQQKHIEILGPGSDLEKERNPTGDNLQIRIEREDGFNLLPRPEFLAHYEQICPGAADRILKIAEGAVAHNHKMEAATLEANISFHKSQFLATRRGQICGLIIGVVAILAGSYIALNGAQITGGFIGSGGVLGLVSVFVIGRRYKSENEEEDDQENSGEN